MSKVRGPLVALLRRKVKENHRLRDELRETQQRNRSLMERLAVANRERDQAHRDAECLALMARDRKTALAFLRDRHGIESLPEVGA